MNCKHTYCDFTSKVQSYLSSEAMNVIFTIGGVNRLDINGEFVYLWSDGKGNGCYSFNLYERDHFTTSITKVGNALSSHFESKIEVLNNRGEFLKKAISITGGLNKAISEAQSYHDYAAYSQRGLSGQNSGAFDLVPNMNQNLLSNQSLVPQLYPQQNRFNQEQLHNEIMNLSFNQLQYAKQIFYVYVNELPIVPKELFNPSVCQSFFKSNGLTYKNRYIPSEYLTKHPSACNLSNSSILSFIFAMAKNDVAQAIKIFTWLVNIINTLRKMPYALVLHSENDIYMKLFYEEIVIPLFNERHCEKISGDGLNEKSLSKQLDEKIICNYHNITTPVILDKPAKEFTNRLIHKSDSKLNNTVITTVANILITSTSRYIPLIAKDVPCLVVDVESSMDHICIDMSIGSNYYQAAQHLKDDLDNFISIARHIDLNRLNNACNVAFYKDEYITDILDGDADLLEVFNAFIKNKVVVAFVLLKTKAPKLYKILIDDFDKNRVNRKNLIEYFTILFGEDIYKKNQNRKLIEDLRMLSQTDEPFDSNKVCNIRGEVYYCL